MRFRLAFWMKDPAGSPGDVVEVPDARVPALVRAGIGSPEDTPAPDDGEQTGTDETEPSTPAAARRKTPTKAAKTD